MRGRRQRKLKPDALLQLNLDVLFLIAEHLHLKDVLSLSRTCKSLRELLMDKSSTFVWKTARGQVEGLPDCPADLTEQAYADLLFDARCHRCGWKAPTILWHIRRRYCADCRLERLVKLESCDEVICDNDVLPVEELTIDKECSQWVDADQMESFLVDYYEASDKNLFLDDRKKKCRAIWSHACDCEGWQYDREMKRRKNLEQRRRERGQSIFERLKEHGYEREIEYFGQPEVRDSYKSVFRTSKLLTDKEWGRIWPEWSNIMETFRSRRLSEVVYPQRRASLAIEYETYLSQLSPNTATFDLHPHVADVACFSPFKDIIVAPETSQTDDALFPSAFAQLPTLVGEWKKRLDSKLAQLVNIPSCLSSENLSGDQIKTFSGVTPSDSSQTSTKLRLACALFSTGHGIFSHPEVFSPMGRVYSVLSEADSDSIELVKDCCTFIEEAPYIVHLCGLDPNVATVDDMDRRNARLRCLWKNPKSRNLVMNWREAIWHIKYHSRYCWGWSPDPDDSDEDGSDKIPPLAQDWQLVSDEHIDAIQSVEQSLEKPLQTWRRCLLCPPSVGDGLKQYDFVDHFTRRHNLEENEIKQGVHYVPLGMCGSPAEVEMVESGVQVTFKIRESSRYYPAHSIVTESLWRRRLLALSNNQDSDSESL